MKQFYRIAKWLIAAFIVVNILVKTFIWFNASTKNPLKGPNRYDISIRRNIRQARYTTKTKQKIFNWVDSLLTPALTLSFIIVAVKFIKTPGIFAEPN